MRHAPCFLLSLLAVVLTLAPLSAGAQEDPLGFGCPVPEDAAGPEAAQLFFPDHGTINALVVFVQHRDDYFEHCWDYTTDTDLSTNSPGANNPCYAGPDVPHLESWTDDVATEWSAEWSRGSDRRLPQWASNEWLAEPDSSPSSYVEGSLSQYYHVNSWGRFRLHGYVYPEVYIPEHDPSWYRTHPHPFENGGVRLSHEILSSDSIQAYVDSIPDAHLVFDRYTNGTNVTVDSIGDAARDGIFDMVILIFRFNKLCELGVYLDDSGECISEYATAITSLGSSAVYRWEPEFQPWYDGFSPDPLYLGGLQVRDNLASGSGVWSIGYNSRTATLANAHEIGHRQLYYKHAEDDFYAVMNGTGNGLTMFAASERVQLGWTTLHTLNIDELPDPITPFALGDAFQEGEVLSIKRSALYHSLVEARTHSNFWDRPPDGVNADGDRNDQYITDEGLLIQRVEPNIGDWSTSMENHGMSVEDTTGTLVRPPGVYYGDTHFTFSPGDAYTPFSKFPFFFMRNLLLDRRAAITDITPVGTGFGFNVWRDYLIEDASPKVLRTNYTFEKGPSLGYIEDWVLGGTFRFDAGFEFLTPPHCGNCRSITLLPDARFVVPIGVDARLKGKPEQPFPFTAGTGARVMVDGISSVPGLLPGSFHTEHVAFSATDAGGWKGLYFGTGAYGRLYDTRVEGVVWPTAQLTNAAVAAYGANLVLDDESVIRGAEKAHGLLAVGGTATVKGSSRIFENEGYGAVASTGATVTVEGGTEVELNAAGGVGGTGYGTSVVFGPSEISLNGGPGVHVTANASAYFESTVVSGDQVFVERNAGGVSATGGGYVNAGMCDGPTICNHIPHQITESTVTGPFDARSVTGSMLFAQGDFWGDGIDDPSDLVLVQDTSSYLSVVPIATTPGSPPRLAGNGGRRAADAPTRGSGQAAVALIAEAERLLAAGDTTAAGALVVDALTGVAADTTAAEDDRRAAFEGAGRFLALTQPAAAFDWLGARADEGGALRPWALRGLAVAHASAGEAAGAEDAASALVDEDPSGEHGLAGHGHLVRLAVAGEDEAGALSRLEAMAVSFPEEEATAQAASVVAAAFPDADVEGVLNGALGRMAGTDPASGPAQVSATAGDAPASFAVSAVRPNPVSTASGRVALDVSLSVDARVEVVLYDALGRRLGVVHAGGLQAGEHALALTTAALPSGIYLVYIRVRDVGGSSHVAMRRFTVAR